MREKTPSNSHGAAALSLAEASCSRFVLSPVAPPPPPHSPEHHRLVASMSVVLKKSKSRKSTAAVAMDAAEGGALVPAAAAVAAPAPTSGKKRKQAESSSASAAAPANGKKSKQREVEAEDTNGEQMDDMQTIRQCAANNRSATQCNAALRPDASRGCFVLCSVLWHYFRAAANSPHSLCRASSVALCFALLCCFRRVGDAHFQFEQGRCGAAFQ